MVVIRILWFFVLIQVYFCQEYDEDSTKKPIWNIAHMVNARYQADYYLDMGANSLEFDIVFDQNGEALFTYHGIPCDCFRSCRRYERIDVYLEYMRRLTTPDDSLFREQLVLLFLDLKVQGLSYWAKRRAGADIAKKLLNGYWQRGESKARAYIMFSVPSTEHLETMYGFKNYLNMEGFKQYESMCGFDFSGNEDLGVIRSAYLALNITDHIWQSDGITNCLPRGTRRLRNAISIRDSDPSTFIQKVYWWTVDKASTMRSTLRLGVDGMITNYPERLVNVLNEREFSSRLRLATIDDIPWMKYPVMSAALQETKYPTARGGNISVLDNSNDEEEEILYNC